MSNLSLNYLLPVFKNKTSKTDFVLCEKMGGFCLVFLSLFLFSPVNGVLVPQSYIFFYTNNNGSQACEGFPVSTQD